MESVVTITIKWNYKNKFANGNTPISKKFTLFDKVFALGWGHNGFSAVSKHFFLHHASHMITTSETNEEDEDRE